MAVRDIEEFFKDFRQDYLAGAEANSSFQLEAFMSLVGEELTQNGFVEGFEYCHFHARRGMRVDGYWFGDDGVLDIFVADFGPRLTIESLTKTDAEALLRRARTFFEASVSGRLHSELEESAPEYGLARQIAERGTSIRKVNLIGVSDRELSSRLQSLDDMRVGDVIFSSHIWDLSRLHRQHESRGQKEPLDLDLVDLFGSGVPCLSAHGASALYESYLLVMPGEVLATLYEKYGARLLEQNVRCFLQVRGKVNKGIRNTILSEPGMFFAYNNGVTATAQRVEVVYSAAGPTLTRIHDLQIVNGGQTTASLFHTSRGDKAALDSVFVQMKLTVIAEEDSEQVVPSISEFANTQNRVSAADFFSNHPFHIRVEEFSRRIWAPARDGAQRETKWFYERARGQYADAQSKLSVAQRKKFLAEYPKSQMFTKTDLAKFEGVWEDDPIAVHLGAQKNFAKFASQIGARWKNDADSFNEFYYRRLCARAIVFREAEKIVSAQSWYGGGYRANIVAYSISMLAEIARIREQALDVDRIWQMQSLPEELKNAIAVSAAFVNERITRPPSGIVNVTEWCKRESCWTGLKCEADTLAEAIGRKFFATLTSKSVQNDAARDAKSVQKIDNGIEAQKFVLKRGAAVWRFVLEAASQKGILSEKDKGILRIASQMPNKIPTEKQSIVLLQILNKCTEEGIALDVFA